MSQRKRRRDLIKGYDETLQCYFFLEPTIKPNISPHRSTWTSLPTTFNVWVKMTCSKWWRWCTTTKPRTRTPKTTSNVSRARFSVSKRTFCFSVGSANPAKTEGEFHVDLYTLPDSLVRMLWEFSQEKLA